MQELYDENYKIRFLIHIHKQKYIPDEIRLEYLKNPLKLLEKRNVPIILYSRKINEINLYVTIYTGM